MIKMFDALKLVSTVNNHIDLDSSVIFFTLVTRASKSFVFPTI